MDLIHQNESKTNPSQNKKDSAKIHKHSQHPHDQLSSDCQGCQEEKKQNQKLVDCYNRLDKITHKVKNIKQKNRRQNHDSLTQKELKQIPQKKEASNPILLQKGLKNLQQKLNISQLPSSIQIKNFDSKEIGFQLAAALIQRQMKYKSENRKLKQKINQLLKQKAILSKTSRNHQNHQNPATIQYKQDKLISQIKLIEKNQIQTMQDSLSSLKTQRIQQQKILGNKTRDISFWQMGNFTQRTQKNDMSHLLSTKNETSFSRISNKNDTFLLNKNTYYNEKSLFSNRNSNQKNPYNTEGNYGLNLWLYQFQPHQFQQNLTNISLSKNQSKTNNKTSQKKPQFLQLKNKKYQNINKSTIIQQNLLQNNLTFHYKNKNH